MMSSCSHTSLSFSSLNKPLRRRGNALRRPTAAAVSGVEASPVARYDLTSWTDFELGMSPVFLDTTSGLEPEAGEIFTVYFNPLCTKLGPTMQEPPLFHADFNSKVCGDRPVQMRAMKRGPNCNDIYCIHVNVPEYATHVDIAFSNKSGIVSEAFRTTVVAHKRHSKRSQEFMNSNIMKELSGGTACEIAMFPEPHIVTENCKMPVGQIATGANYCDLDMSTGCTNPDAVNYDPLATSDSGSCEIPQ